MLPNSKSDTSGLMNVASDGKPNADVSIERFFDAARIALTKVLGESGARAVFFHVGLPNPATFEQDLSSFLGEGASVIIEELRTELQSPAPAKKRRTSLRVIVGPEEKSML